MEAIGVEVRKLTEEMLTRLGFDNAVEVLERDSISTQDRSGILHGFDLSAPKQVQQVDALFVRRTFLLSQQLPKVFFALVDL